MTTSDSAYNSLLVDRLACPHRVKGLYEVKTVNLEKEIKTLLIRVFSCVSIRAVPLSPPNHWLSYPKGRMITDSIWGNCFCKMNTKTKSHIHASFTRDLAKGLRDTESATVTLLRGSEASNSRGHRATTES
jgi:hypothetical protein